MCRSTWIQDIQTATENQFIYLFICKIVFFFWGGGWKFNDLKSTHTLSSTFSALSFASRNQGFFKFHMNPVNISSLCWDSKMQDNIKFDLILRYLCCFVLSVKVRVHFCHSSYQFNGQCCLLLWKWIPHMFKKTYI